MVPARLNKNFVIIQAPTEIDSNWNEETGYAFFRKAWVSITPERGREIGAADETIAIVTHTIRGDFLALDGITEKMRVIYSPKGVYDPIPNDAQVYEVLAVMPDEINRQDIMLKAQINGRRYSAGPV